MKRKSSKSKVILLAMAAGFFILFSIMYNPNEKVAAPEPVKVQVLAASENLDVGSILSIDKMSWNDVSEKELKDGFVTKKQTDVLQQLDGSVVKKAIPKGKNIDLHDLVTTQGKSPLSAVIHEGMRAVAVPYNKLANAPSLIAPGDVVDIIMPKRVAGGEDGYFGETILQNIRVLAVDNSLKKTDSVDPKTPLPQNITLEVSADQAENLAASIRDGQVVVSMHSVFANEAPFVPVKKEIVVPHPSKDTRVVKIFRGTEKKELTFNNQAVN